MEGITKIFLTGKYDVLSQSSGHSHPVCSLSEIVFDLKATAIELLSIITARIYNQYNRNKIKFILHRINLKE